MPSVDFENLRALNSMIEFQTIILKYYHILTAQ